jgi:hypothetical protein
LFGAGGNDVAASVNIASEEDSLTEIHVLLNVLVKVSEQWRSMAYDDFSSVLNMVSEIALVPSVLLHVPLLSKPSKEGLNDIPTCEHIQMLLIHM